MVGDMLTAHEVFFLLVLAIYAGLCNPNTLIALDSMEVAVDATCFCEILDSTYRKPTGYRTVLSQVFF
jgi:hypothetical protein